MKKKQVREAHLMVFVSGNSEKGKRKDQEPGRPELWRREVVREEETEGILSITWNAQAAAAKSKGINVQWTQNKK